MMGIWDRVVLTGFALGMAAVSLLGILAGLGWQEPVGWLEAGLERGGGRAAIALVSLVFLAVSGRFLYFGFRRHAAGQTLVHETPLGEVRVTLAAVESLVTRTSRQVKGVRDVRCWVASRPEGLAIAVRTVVSPDVSVPEVASELQRTIKQAVQTVVGVAATEVRVFVQNISSEPRRGRGD